MPKKLKGRVDQKRILIYGDSPTVATGFATVVRNIANQLHKHGWNIDILGINHQDDWYDRKKYPYRIIPAMPIGLQGDFYGREKLIGTLLGQHPQVRPPWDIFFTVQDSFIMETIAGTIRQIADAYRDPENNFVDWRGQKIKLNPDTNMEFKWISYNPVDSSLKENWVRDSILLADVPVAYTKYAKQEIDIYNFNPDTGEAVRDVPIIYHGYDPDIFYPLPRAERRRFRRDFFGMADKKFLVTNINRNQPRKDIPRTLAIFKEFKKHVKDAFLYLHMKVDDVGGNIAEVAREFNLTEGEDWITPAAFNENKGTPIEVVNKIYNISDVIISTTLGEGFGLSYVEAMATKTPVLAPRNTAAVEIFDNERGFLYKCQTTKSEWINFGQSDNNINRPLANVEDGAKQLLYMYNNPQEMKKRAAKAHKWIKNYTWEKIGKEWNKLFEESLTVENADNNL